MYIEFVRNLLLQTERRAKEAEKIRGREERQRDLKEDRKKKKGERRELDTQKKMTEEKDDKEVRGRKGRK